MNSAKAAPQSTTRKTFALFGGAAFVVIYLTALLVVRTGAPEALKVALSVSAVAAFALFLVAGLRIVRGLDELEQRIQLEALAFSFPLSVALVMLLGLLQRFWQLPIEDASYRHIWPVMILFYALGLVLARWRYR